MGVYKLHGKCKKPTTPMATPAKLEDYLALEDGNCGHPLSSALEFDQREIPNLYSLTADNEFRFSFTEYSIAYGEKEYSQRQAAVAFKVLVCMCTSGDNNLQQLSKKFPSPNIKILVSWQLSDGIRPGFTLHFDPTPVTKWGLNFAGLVCVKHSEGQERVIYLPGTRTYDPAGLTGQCHAPGFFHAHAVRGRGHCDDAACYEFMLFIQ